MTKNKRHTCKYSKFGCGGSCYGLKRIQEHEATCRFAPEDDLEDKAMKARLSNLEDIIGGLVKTDMAKQKQIKRMALEIRNLRLQVVDLQSTVSRIVPDYSHITLEFLSLPRYIMKHGESREWATMMRDRCKYDNPKFIFEEFLKYLLETEPYFFKVKSYDAIEVCVDFGEGRFEGRMLLRDFIVRFMEACYILMTDLWSNLKEVNKIPHVPRVLCCGYSDKIVRRLERANLFIEAQYTKSHVSEIMQAYNERVEMLMELARQEFSSKCKRNSKTR